MNAAFAKVVNEEFAASANAIGKVRITVLAVDTDSRQNTDPATFMTSGRPLAIAGVPPVTVRTRTAEW